MLYIIISPKIIFYNLILRTWVMQSWSNIVNSWCKLKFWVTPFFCFFCNPDSALSTHVTPFFGKSSKQWWNVVKVFFVWLGHAFIKARLGPAFIIARLGPAFIIARLRLALHFIKARLCPAFIIARLGPAFIIARLGPAFISHCQAWPCIIPNLSLCTAEC